MAQEKTLITDLTEGSVLKQLIRFSLPLMAANILQVSYNLVDMFFLGQYGGTDALSASSIGGQITVLMFFCFIGIATGGQIYIAQTVGAKRQDELNYIAGNTLTLCMLTSLILMIAIPLARPILNLMNTPEEIMDISMRYLIILTIGNVPVALYNGLCALLRGMGDSIRPSIFVGVATVVNIAMDYVFVARLHWGAPGAAWATVIGQSVACLFAIGYLYRHRHHLGFTFRFSGMLLKAKYTKVILQLGIPITTKSLFISLSSMYVNAQINAFGVVAVAVAGLCAKIQSMMNVVAQSMNDSTSALVGQCIGSRKPERVNRVVWCALFIGLCFAAVLSACFLLFPHQIFGIFSNDAAVIAEAPAYLGTCVLSVLAGAMMAPFLGMINGVGDTVYNMIVAIIDGVVARLGLSILLGFAMGMGALGFFMGSALAGFASVIGGAIYFFGGWWRKKALTVAGDAPADPSHG
ncbi:MAG: MATE family efflux transporter [Oscillospiraceae bacterium]|nr:MATE family efflux transporter [Oscillospiraceae bacterium]